MATHCPGILTAGFSFCWLFATVSFCQQQASLDLRAATVEAFMAARTLEHNVEARKLMTASLENDYLHNKRLSIRVRSGRVAAFDFDTARISQSGDNEFFIEVESIWADLNEQAFATQYERLKFVKVKNEWLADGIEFLRSQPGQKLLYFNVESDKRAKLALAVVKKFMKAVVNHNPHLASQFTTQEFQSRVDGLQRMEELLAGPADPYYTAFELRGLTQKTPHEMEVRVGFYLVRKGKKGVDTLEGRLLVKEGSTDWNVDDFQIDKS